jgi:hypothetical protein
MACRMSGGCRGTRVPPPPPPLLLLPPLPPLVLLPPLLALLLLLVLPVLASLVLLLLSPLPLPLLLLLLLAGVPPLLLGTGPAVTPASSGTHSSAISRGVRGRPALARACRAGCAASARSLEEAGRGEGGGCRVDVQRAECTAGMQ